MSNTGNNIQIIERNLQPHWSRFDHLVSACDLTPRRWLETVMMALEENPRAMDMPVIQHVRFANTSATLSLEPGGAAGQMFAIPFGGKSPYLQPVIGYKGFNTTAARAGISINGDVLREGDTWTPEIVAGEPFRVRPKFGDRQRAPIIGAWAQARLPSGAYTVVRLMDLSELEAVRAKSPGARMSSSPWNDVQGPGYAAMCAKTAKRQLQRELPMIVTKRLEAQNISQHTLAGGVDTMHEEVGKRSYIGDRYTVETGGRAIDQDDIPRHEDGSAIWMILRKGRAPDELKSRSDWMDRWHKGFAAATTVAQIDATMDAMKPVFERLKDVDPDAVMDVLALAEDRKGALEQSSD